MTKSRRSGGLLAYLPPDFKLPPNCRELPEADGGPEFTEYTEKEAAERLRVSPRFLRGERSAGRIGYVQRGRKVLYPASTLREYQESQVTRVVPPPGAVRLTGSPDWRAVGRRARRLAI